MLTRYMQGKKYFFVWSEYFFETWWARIVTVDGVTFLIRVYANNADQMVTAFTDPVVMRIYDADSGEEVCDPEPYPSLKAYLGVHLTERLKPLAAARAADLLAEI